VQRDAAVPTLDLAIGIPGGVMGWMAAWGVWPPAASDKVPVTSGPWLPAASGRTIHLAQPATVDRHLGRALAVCRSGARDVQLVMKDPLPPGEAVERGSFLLSLGSFGVWQKVGAALDLYDDLRRASGDTYGQVDVALDLVARVSRDEIGRDGLPSLGARWQTTPAAARPLLPWLIVAAANGIESCCQRCDRPHSFR
jgi:hypothetical protein